MSSHPKYRPDIDGLRAIAILSVVIFHATPEMLPGGFIGVDVFFVISGFLISQIILTNLQQNTFSFTEFYARRIKRIFPVLLLVLSTCLIFGGIILLADEYQQLGKHLTGGAAFLSNFVLWNEVGYFDNAADTKPLLHLWSLGIEEQFYIVWPLFLWACWKKGIRLFWPIAILAAASFTVNIVSVNGNQEAAFYSPLSRFWELMAGSYLAYLMFPAADHPVHRRLASMTAQMQYPGVATAMSLLGMSMLLIAFAVIDRTSHFPGGWALLPVFAAFLLLAAGPGAWINRQLLARSSMVWIGLISYPLYLWHWPILSFARIIEGETPAWNIQVLAVTLSIVLAWASYKFWETPIRFKLGKRVPTTFVLILLMSAVGILGYSVNTSNGLKYRLTDLGHGEDPFVSPKTKLKQERKLCRSQHPEMPGICFSSNATATSPKLAAIFVGDSHSEALSTGFIQQFPDVPASSFGLFGCPPFVGVERFSQKSPIGCAATLDKTLNKLVPPSDAAIILTARYSLYISGHGYGQAEAIKTEDSHIQYGDKTFKPQNDYEKAFISGLRATLEQLTAQNKKVIFVHQIPELGFDPRICTSRPFRAASHHPCRLDRAEVMARQRAYRKAADPVLSDFPQVLVFDPVDYLCDEKYCYARQGNAVLYRDDDHLSLGGAGMLSVELAKLLHR